MQDRIIRYGLVFYETAYFKMLKKISNKYIKKLCKIYIMKYTRKQISEAIKYWQAKLK